MTAASPTSSSPRRRTVATSPSRAATWPRCAGCCSWWWPAANAGSRLQVRVDSANVQSTG
eukprot:12524931-Alexandrium_andersonii.AAC.1